MSIKVYDLCGEDRDVRFSPFCWLAKFALMHKGLAFETVALGFTEKENYPDKEYKFLPSLEIDGQLVHDSSAIIDYLDKQYPEPPFFKSEGERAAYGIVQAYVGAHLFPGLGPMMFARVHNAISDADQAYFRETREQRLGVTLEDAAANPELPQKVEAALAVLSTPLQAYDYFGGDAPNLTDYLIASIFQWQRAVCSDTLYDAPPSFIAWQDRMLDLFDGWARNAARAA